jgi:hypothetical protein
MTDKQIVNILTRSFRNLLPEEKDNLRWHVERGSGIFCGEGSQNNYVNSKGFG